MMNESKKSVLNMFPWFGFAVGIMVMLNGIQMKGEAVENLIVHISSNILFFGGIGLSLTSIISLIVLLRLKNH